MDSGVAGPGKRKYGDSEPDFALALSYAARASESALTSAMHIST